MTTVDVHLEPDWSPHPVPADTCEHGPEAAISVGVRIVSHRIQCDATVCMDCGTVTQGDMSVRDALLSLWERYGWNYKIGKRLCELATRYNRSLLK